MPRSAHLALADRLRQFPAVYGPARRIFHAVQAHRAPLVVEGVPGRVHRNDLMYEVGRPGYVARAMQIVDLLERDLAEIGRELARSDVLDFGCGYGRISRHLARRCRTLSACDIDHDAVRFCASEFLAVPVFGQQAVDQVRFWHYDAIWMGSVITHVPARDAERIIHALAARVRPGGLLVVSRSGATLLETHLASPHSAWMRSHADDLRRGLATDGAAYVSYPERHGEYGLAFHTGPWLDERAGACGLVPLHDAPVDWDGQRVHTYVRRP